MGDTATETATQATEAPKAPDRTLREPKSISEQMDDLGWDKEAKHDENPNTLGAKARAARAAGGGKGKARPTAEVTETATTEEAAADASTETDEAAAEKTAEAKAVEAENPKIAQLKSLISELGYALEDGRVTTKERAEIRIARRELQVEQKRLEQEAMGRIEAATKSLEEREKGLSPREAKLAEFDKAVSDGDHEQIAKLAGFDSWDKFQEHIIALKADPAYRRLRTLEQELAQRTAREKAEAEKAEAERVEREKTEAQARAERERTEAQTAYVRDLSQKMATSEHPVIKALADDPGFVQAIYRVQVSKYDRVSDTTVTPEEALKLTPPGGTQPLEAELRKLWERLNPYFSAAGNGTTTTNGAAKAAPKQRVEQPKVNRTPQPVSPPPARRAKFDDSTWRQNAIKELEQAAREEALERRSVRR